MRELHRQAFVFFTKGDNVSNLNKVMAYVVENESTNRLKIVTVLREGEAFPQELITDIPFPLPDFRARWRPADYLEGNR
ncbi:hypothetical protein [Hymenobacter crusticola]|uniref:Uncharacterized protein n=1 Tax=Hymenobacter crusticola TaxID=1770526 RepID=A0A243WFY6_9BACT|nr:hypothetical protein [Hymenobacter crusticola]OUJ73821.1 hypothetical protein BXP70_12660 [Hymenobacter crusticola]